MRDARWLSLLLVAACGSGSPPVGAPENAPTVSAAGSTATVAPSISPSAPPVAPQAAPVQESEACLAKPLVLEGKKLAPKAVDPTLPGQLASCGSGVDPERCRYEIARVYLSANRFEEAAPIFRDVALSGPRGELSLYAGMLYLDALNMIGMNAVPQRPACVGELAAATIALKARHCAPPDAIARENCGILDRIEVDIQRLDAENLIKKADIGGPDAASLYRRGGDLFMANFDAHCALRRPDNKKTEPPPGWSGQRCAELAYNAIKSYEAAKEPALAERARGALLDPANRLHTSELAKKAAAPR